MYFKKTSSRTYDDFSIFKRQNDDRYQFEKYVFGSLSFNVLQNCNMWNNINDVEYYEISEDTFDDISKLYNELIK